MNAFETIFTSPIQVYQAIIAAGSALVLSVAFAFLYTFLKKNDGFYRDRFRANEPRRKQNK